ncbi:MAG: hypothetical protein LBP63_06095 [Prevotellaceae bacterium]|jgi:hypothetical protein|nr:hypothetical protein [Prevotellaceae bacterium]
MPIFSPNKGRKLTLFRLNVPPDYELTPKDMEDANKNAKLVWRVKIIFACAFFIVGWIFILIDICNIGNHGQQDIKVGDILIITDTTYGVICFVFAFILCLFSNIKVDIRKK